MKNINLYANNAAYLADGNRPANESTVSMINDGTGLKTEGKNIMVDKDGAAIGDILVFDKTTSIKKFIKAGTYNAASLPASIVTIGVIYYRTEKEVMVVSKSNAASSRWAQGFKVKLTGFDFATGGTFTITANAVETANIVYNIGSNLAAVVASINSALNAGADNTTLKNWTVAAGADYITIEHNWYTPVISTVIVTDAASKIEATALTPLDYQKLLSGLVTPYSSMTRKDGGATSNAGSNFDKYYSYYYTSGADTFDNQPVGSTAGTVRYSRWNTNDNALLVAFYGAGEAGYAKYIADKQAKYPYQKNGIIDENGKLNTSLLAAVTFVDADGTVKPAYPPAYNAKTFTGGEVAGFVTGLEAGAWWLPANREMFLLMKDRLNNNLDTVNKSLTAIGGTVVSTGTSYWTSSETSTNYSWRYGGTNGTLNTNRKYGSISCRPVTAF